MRTSLFRHFSIHFLILQKSIRVQTPSVTVSRNGFSRKPFIFSKYPRALPLIGNILRQHSLKFNGQKVALKNRLHFTHFAVPLSVVKYLSTRVKIKVETTRLFDADCNFICFKKSAINISKFTLNQNSKNLKTEFLKNQKQVAVLLHSWLQNSAFCSGRRAAVAVDRLCPFVPHRMWRRLHLASCLDFYFFSSRSRSRLSIFLPLYEGMYIVSPLYIVQWRDSHKFAPPDTSRTRCSRKFLIRSFHACPKLFRAG